MAPIILTVLTCVLVAMKYTVAPMMPLWLALLPLAVCVILFIAVAVIWLVLFITKL